MSTVEFLLMAGKRFCSFLFQNTKARVAQSRNSTVLITAIAGFKGIGNLPPFRE
jgi:hypothetical protein